MASRPTPEKGWEEVLPADVVRWAHSVFATIIADNDMYCCDNFRVARCGNKSQKKRYRRIQANGCCGFFDTIVEGPHNSKYMIGFNYGH